MISNRHFSRQTLSPETEDKELVFQFRQPRLREKAFEQILKKYQKQTYWHVRRIVIDHDDANDVVQNTFVKVWENLSGFREDSKLYTWIYRIATNEALYFLNKKKASLKTSIEELTFELGEKLQSSHYFDGNHIERKLQEAILTLPEKQRLVFNMKYYENLKYEEMEEILVTSVGALKASYHHAVKKIEVFLKNTLNQSA